MTIEQEKQNLANYIHKFAFEWGKLWNTELTHEQKLARIDEKLKLPEVVVSEAFDRLNIVECFERAKFNTTEETEEIQQKKRISMLVEIMQKTNKLHL